MDFSVILVAYHFHYNGILASRVMSILWEVPGKPDLARVDMLLAPFPETWRPFPTLKSPGTLA